MGTAAVLVGAKAPPLSTVQKQKAIHDKSRYKFAVLCKVIADLDFDQETIGKITEEPRRIINELASRRGYRAFTAEINELRESYRLHLRNFFLDDAMALNLMVMKRFDELIFGAYKMTAIIINDVIMQVMSMTRLAEAT